MKTILAVMCLFLATLCQGQEWKPSDELLNAIRQVESTGGKFVVGDKGRSLGPYQMGKAAWNDVSKWRKARNMKLYSYRTDVFMESLSREYASNYITLLRNSLLEKLRREPSASELYAAYNIGLQRFGSQSKYDVARINSTTARKCRDIEKMISARVNQIASVTPR